MLSRSGLLFPCCLWLRHIVHNGNIHGLTPSWGSMSHLSKGKKPVQCTNNTHVEAGFYFLSFSKKYTLSCTFLKDN